MDFNNLWFQEGSIENQITFADVDAFTFQFYLPKAWSARIDSLKHAVSIACQSKIWLGSD